MRRSFLTFLFLLSFYSAVHGQDDGIPGNCPYTRGVFYQQNLFPRFEGRRAALIDWSTGAEVREIATGLPGGQFESGKWSPECRYVSGSLGNLDERGVMMWDTYVWDAVNGGQVVLFED